MVRQTATCPHSLSAIWYGSHRTPQSGKSLMSWCSVDSLHRAGLSFGPLKRVGGDHSHGYWSHLDLYSVPLGVVLCFATAGQLMQMPATAHSIPRTFQLLLHGLLLEVLGLSHPIWVWLWIQRDCVNPGIWAAFLCVHHCPFLHTCGIYPHDPQNTSFATASIDELGQEEGKMAPPLAKAVHWGMQCHFCLRERASLLMCHLCQVRDTLQVCWQALAEMSLSVIRKWENPPKCRVAIDHTIVQKCPCNPPCVPTQMMNISLAAIDEPSMLPKHPLKCTSPLGSSDLLALSLSTQDQWGVHSPFISRQVVVHWQVLIPTTTLSSKALQSVSSSAPHPVDLLDLQSELHASNSSLQNTIPLHHAFPLQYHPLHLQAHLKTATSSDNASHRVNGILTLKWLEVWIQCSRSSHFASTHYF